MIFQEYNGNKRAFYTLSRQLSSVPGFRGIAENSPLLSNACSAGLLPQNQCPLLLTQLTWEQRDHPAESFHSVQAVRLENVTTEHYDRDP